MPFTQRTHSSHDHPGRLLALICCCLFGLMGIGPARAATEVTLQLRWQHQFQFAGYYAAIAQGYYRDAGLQVILKEGGPGIDAVAEVVSGRSHFGVGLSSLALDYLNGAPVMMLANVFQHSPNTLIARGNNRHLADLANGGRIAIMVGQQDAELKAMFVDEGIALDKLDLSTTSRHLEDFLAGRIDAFNGYVSNEPYLLDKLGVAFTSLKPQTYGIDFYGDLLFTHQNLAANDPALVSAFRTASLRGWQYALDHPDEIIDLILRDYNGQHKTREHLLFEAKALTELIQHQVIELGHANPGRWQHIVDVYRRFGLVHGQQSLNGFLYQSEGPLDWQSLYPILLIAGAAILLGSVLLFFIYRNNRRLARALADKTLSEARYRVMFETSPAAGLLWADDFTILDWNKEATRLFGWTLEEVKGRRFIDFLVVPGEQGLPLANLERLQHNELPHSINNNLTRDGRQLTCEWRNARIPDTPGGKACNISLAIDISERLRLEKENRRMAFRDPLTQLPNRRLLHDRLDRLLRRLRREGGYGSMLFLDLDNFKPLNDRHGHALGDLLLQEVARRLHSCVRESDTVGRFGGDEFVVLIDGLDRDPETARQQAKRVAHKVLTSLGECYRLQQEPGAEIIEHRCTASIGVTLFDAQDSETGIFRQADAAMYQAKTTGRNRYCLAEEPILEP